MIIFSFQDFFNGNGRPSNFKKICFILLMKPMRQKNFAQRAAIYLSAAQKIEQQRASGISDEFKKFEFIIIIPK